MTTAQTLRRTVAERARVPLYRNGYALVASSFTTSGLGFLYWLVAARSYSAEAVGVGAALIAATTLLADVSQLNLKSVLNRFLPRAGRTAPKMVVAAYVVAFGLAACAAAVFALGAAVWSPQTLFLVERPEIALVFVLGVGAWTLFVLQDSALVGIRAATWVPVENVVYSLGKIGALVLLAAAFPILGVYLSWVILLPALLIAVNLLLFARLIPRHVDRTGAEPAPIARREVAAYVGGDWLAFAVWSATSGLLPLLILNAVGPEATAYYFISWSIGYALYIVTSGMGMSLITEASLDRERLGDLARRSAVESARVVVPGALAIIVGAPWILRLMGEDYSGSAANVLRLLALSAIPYIVVGTAANVARVQQRMGRVVAIYTAVAVLVLGLSWPLLNMYGITGVGLAWVVGQSVVAAALLAPAALDALVRRAPKRWLDAASSLRRGASRRRQARQAMASAPGALRLLGRDAWAPASPLGSDGAVLVTRVAAPDGGVAILRAGHVAEGRAAIGRSSAVLRELHDDDRLTGWAHLVPRLIDQAATDDGAFALEQEKHGFELATFLDGADADRAMRSAIAAISDLHDLTGQDVTLNQADIGRLVGTSVAELGRDLGADRVGVLMQLGSEVITALAQSRRRLCRVHGDYAPRNILLTADGARVTGIVDWESSDPRHLPEIDLIHIALTSAAEALHMELGQIVAELLRGSALPPSAPPAAAEIVPETDTHEGRALLLLTWLHHAAVNRRKSAGYSPGGVWFTRNVEVVLDAIAGDPEGATKT